MPSPSEMFPEEPEDTQEAIMKATYEALRKHGYADLTIQRIGDEFSKSKSLLYHHYDSKDALLLDFLAFMLERVKAQLPMNDQFDAGTRLEEGLDHIFTEMLVEDQKEFVRAFVELRAQAAHDPAFRDRFALTDQYFHELMADLVEDGIEEGIFRDVDPESFAEMFITVVEGVRFRWATNDEFDLEQARAELESYVEARLLDQD